jgi:hypothetical protein
MLSCNRLWRSATSSITAKPLASGSVTNADSGVTVTRPFWQDASTGSSGGTTGGTGSGGGGGGGTVAVQLTGDVTTASASSGVTTIDPVRLGDKLLPHFQVDTSGQPVAATDSIVQAFGKLAGQRAADKVVIDALSRMADDATSANLASTLVERDEQGAVSVGAATVTSLEVTDDGAIVTGGPLTAGSATLSSPLPTGSGGTGLSSVANGGLLVGASSNTVDQVGVNLTSTKLFLSQNSGNKPAWSALPSAVPQLTGDVTTDGTTNVTAVDDAVVMGKKLAGFASTTAGSVSSGSTLVQALSRLDGGLAAATTTANAGAATLGAATPSNTSSTLVLRSSTGAVAVGQASATSVQSSGDVASGGTMRTDVVDCYTAAQGNLTVGGTATTGNVSVAPHAATLNLGGPTTTINMMGPANNIQSTDVYVRDRTAVLNAGGPVGSSALAGMYFEEAGQSDGSYFRVNAARDGFEGRGWGAPAQPIALSGVNTGDQTDIPGNAATCTTIPALSGAVISSGSSNVTSLADASVVAAKVVGFASSTGTMSADDSIRSALGKLNGNLQAVQSQASIGANAVSGATASNTPGALVMRDANGDISVGVLSAASATLTTALPVPSGGTGLSAVAKGSLLYAMDTNTMSAVQPAVALGGTARLFLSQVADEQPQWSAATQAPAAPDFATVNPSQITPGTLVYRGGDVFRARVPAPTLAPGAAQPSVVAGFVTSPTPDTEPEGVVRDPTLIPQAYVTLRAKTDLTLSAIRCFAEAGEQPQFQLQINALGGGTQSVIVELTLPQPAPSSGWYTLGLPWLEYVPTFAAISLYRQDQPPGEGWYVVPYGSPLFDETLVMRHSESGLADVVVAKANEWACIGAPSSFCLVSVIYKTVQSYTVPHNTDFPRGPYAKLQRGSAVSTLIIPPMKQVWKSGEGGSGVTFSLKGPGASLLPTYDVQSPLTAPNVFVNETAGSSSSTYVAFSASSRQFTVVGSFADGDTAGWVYPLVLTWTHDGSLI